ncbi:MAG: formamidopyrimidine-DNA glycosylase [Gemmatimonadetes bacterium]|nr:formamidopyrimidine-DNA glycosylase [Gemmatimonadota bacterium]
MPELPEVERAVGVLRKAVAGQRIASLKLLHPALRRQLAPRVLRSLVGARITGVARRGKHQMVSLEDGRTLHVHFRMSGDWKVLDDAPLAKSVRAVLTLESGARVAFVDPRALGTMEIHGAGVDAAPGLGPEANDPALTAKQLRASFAPKRGPIKPVLLDQRVIAGVGNIYAAEALWHAKLDPTRKAAALEAKEVSALLAALRKVLKRATGSRYTDDASRFDVYGRAGKPCRRCGEKVERIVQAGRSTYFCPNCQL